MARFAVLLLLVAAHCVFASDKVSVGIYIESLCPDCKQFIAGQFNTAFNTAGINDIVDWNIVPYGNAHQTQDSTGKWAFTCQHGAKECQGNLIETCAIRLSKQDVTVYAPFLICMEQSQDPIGSASACAQKTGMDFDAISACVASDDGNQYQHEMAADTEALTPAHQYVPWITINGQHDDDIQSKAENNLIAVICSSYTGSSRPAACASLEDTIATPKSRCPNPNVLWI
eukprot:GILK01004336.1.p1 GENE.GILK01004336.1~~GILK01004336.1.p1  ORF type:complete len:229 (-),score=29.38 GILK01004336.1:137-823(-)